MLHGQARGTPGAGARVMGSTPRGGASTYSANRCRAFSASRKEPPRAPARKAAAPYSVTVSHCRYEVRPPSVRCAQVRSGSCRLPLAYRRCRSVPANPAVHYTPGMRRESAIQIPWV